jgi:hypothetical protein
VATKCYIPRSASKPQQKRLRKVIDQLSPWQRKGLQEYLYANRDHLESVIRNLEDLVKHDTLNKVLDDAIEGLERGKKFKHGELIAIGGRRAYPAELIPDIAGISTREPTFWGQMLDPKKVKKAMQALGRKLNEFGKVGKLPGAVADAWDTAVKAAKASKGDIKTAAHYTEVLYPEAQRQFWIEVKKNTTARKFFEERGFFFPPDGAPLFAAAKNLPDTFRMEFRISLDHIAPKAQFWQQALDADNLRFVTQWDNWLLDQIDRFKRKFDPGFK